MENHKGLYPTGADILRLSQRVFEQETQITQLKAELLRQKKLYQAAVNGRKDFRQAFREERNKGIQFKADLKEAQERVRELENETRFIG